MARACAKPRIDRLAHTGEARVRRKPPNRLVPMPAEQFARAHASNRQFGLRPYVSVAGCISGRPCHRRPAAWVSHVGVFGGMMRIYECDSVYAGLRLRWKHSFPKSRIVFRWDRLARLAPEAPSGRSGRRSGTPHKSIIRFFSKSNENEEFCGRRL